MAEDNPSPSSILHHPPSSHPPPTLAYDDLPPGSDIRREYLRDGDARQVRIVVPAGEPPPPVMRIALFDSFASGARTISALLALALLLFTIGLRNNRVSGVPLAYAWAFFAVFCAALVLLVAWVRYGLQLDAIRYGRQQMTVLAATPTRLLIETMGPFGIASYDFPRETMKRLDVVRGVLRDDRNLPRRVTHVALSLADGRTICLLPARDERELRWICGAVRQALGMTS